MKMHSIMGHKDPNWTPTKEDWSTLVKNINTEILKLHTRVEKLEKEKKN